MDSMNLNESILAEYLKISNECQHHIEDVYDEYRKIDPSANADDYYAIYRASCTIANLFFNMKENIKANNFAAAVTPVIYPFTDRIRYASSVLNLKKDHDYPRSHAKPPHSVTPRKQGGVPFPSVLSGRKYTRERLQMRLQVRSPRLALDSETHVLPIINDFSRANIHDIFPTGPGSNSLYYEIEKVLEKNPETKKSLGNLLKYTINGHDYYEVRDKIFTLIVSIIQLYQALEEKEYNENSSPFYYDFQEPIAESSENSSLPPTFDESENISSSVRGKALNRRTSKQKELMTGGVKNKSQRCKPDKVTANWRGSSLDSVTNSFAALTTGTMIDDTPSPSPAVRSKRPTPPIQGNNSATKTIKYPSKLGTLLEEKSEQENYSSANESVFSQYRN
jgi:hypothetical protein